MASPAPPNAGQYFREPSTGLQVFSRDGEVYLRPKNWTPGQPLVAVSNAEAAARIGQGDLLPASAEDVRARDLERQHGGFAGQAATFGKAALAGATDVVTAPVRAGIAGAQLALGETDDLDPLGPIIGGRGAQERAAGLLGGDDAARAYAQTAREQAETNPTAAAAGYATGQIAAGLGTAGAVSKLGQVAASAGRAAGLGQAAATAAGRTAAGAAEGALIGGAQAGEEAYLKDAPLTRDQLVAGMGLGALFGGAAGLATGAGETLAQRVFGRSKSRGATPVGSPRLGPYRSADEAIEQVSGRVLGEGIEPAPGLGSKVRDALEGAQSAATGAERETLQKFGGLRWDSEARAGRQLWRNREEILEGATRDLTERIDDVAKKSSTVFDEVVDSGLKRENIASKLSDNAEAQLGLARQEVSRVRQEVAAIRANAEQYGNAALGKRIDQFTAALAKEVDTVDDAAAAFIALDKTKRGLQRWSKSLRQSGGMSQDALKRQQSFALGDKLAEIQEGTRQSLMNDAVWGAAAKDQRAINQAWEKYFESNNVFGNNFTTRTGVDFNGRPIVVADPKKVASYVRGLGKQEARLVDEHFRAHVQATKQLAEAIDDAFDLGTKKAAVRSVAESASTIEATLAKADKTVKVANQIDAVIQAEQSGGASVLGGAFGGGLLGGPVGALAGAAFGAVTRPGTLLRQAAAFEQLAGNVASKLDGKLSKWFASWDKPAAAAGRAITKARQLPAKAGKASQRVAPQLAGFAQRGEDKQTAYRNRVAELQRWSDPRVANAQLTEALGPAFETMPKFTGSMTATLVNGVAFLTSKIPAGASRLNPLAPGDRDVIVGDQDIARFARYWNAVTNPLSVLDDIADGTVTQEQIESLKVVYPDMFADMQRRVLTRLQEQDTPPPYQARATLDLVLDLDGAGEPSMGSAFQSRYTQYVMADQQAQQQRGQPPGAGRPPNLAASFATQSEGTEL